ncbi:YggT family protein [Finegoldia magna]|uniref:YggT family protein n=1 Tax=Finegoldia magna TaxID=1260 RepID=UPI00399C0A3A
MINGFSIVNFFLTILKLIEWSIFIRVILSFVHISRDNALVDSIYLITDYIMYPAKILLGMFGLDRSIIDWVTISNIDISSNYWIIDNRIGLK